MFNDRSLCNWLDMLRLDYKKKEVTNGYFLFNEFLFNEITSIDKRIANTLINELVVIFSELLLIIYLLDNGIVIRYFLLFPETALDNYTKFNC